MDIEQAFVEFDLAVVEAYRAHREANNLVKEEVTEEASEQFEILYAQAAFLNMAVGQLISAVSTLGTGLRALMEALAIVKQEEGGG